MANWTWLTQSRETYNQSFVIRVLVKAIALFLLLNVLYVMATPLPAISSLTVYNSMVPGRERLPYSDNPSEARNLSLQRIEGMVASHVITRDKAPDEYRVVFVGDSSVWGVLLDNNHTLTGCINNSNLLTSDGRTVIAYNLGYPVLSVLKDLMILEDGLDYDVDAVVWVTTMQALFDNEQLRHPIVGNNSDLAAALIGRYELAVDTSTLRADDSFFERTIVGQRRELSDWLRYQVYGLAWWMTGEDYAPVQYLGAPVSNLPASRGILNRSDVREEGLIEQGLLAVDVLEAGLEMLAGKGVPVLIVNEPIFISSGLNSDLRYNEYYPRWAYDEYRSWLIRRADEGGWNLLDLWDAVAANKFTDTPFHYDSSVSCAVADQIGVGILELAGQ